MKKTYPLNKRLGLRFFQRDTKTVARELIGKEILRTVNGKVLRARIVETEAYLPKKDPACHASRGLTPRNSVMFGPAGHIYVYFIYGNYEMLNFVTETNGIPGAVLIRALEPIEGVSEMTQNRGTNKLQALTSGPAKLTMALSIDRNLNKLPISPDYLDVLKSKQSSRKVEIVQTTRIGIREGKNLKLRFYEKDNPFVSVK